MSDAYAALSLESKSVLITGAATGIGRESAKLIAARGAAVTLADINADEGERLAAEIASEGGEAQFVRTDVSSEGDVEHAVSCAVATYGGLHGAFNNAGVNEEMLLHETTDELWQHVLGVNLSGIFYGLKHEIAYMSGHGGGSIVNTSSLAGVKSVPGMGAYVASKHGVVGLTRAASQDYARQGIRVNAILPALIETPMFYATTDTVAEILKSLPIGRAGHPRDVAEQAAFLLSDAAQYSTGSLFAVDGGSNSM